MSAGPGATAVLCSQVELRRRSAVEQVQLHQHAAVCGWRAGRAWGGDAHHDVSGTQCSVRVCVCVDLLPSALT